LQRTSDSRIIILVDQSGSMADSIVYAGVFASVLASLRALRTTVVAFDTLDMVVGTAVMGKPLPALVEGDALSGVSPKLVSTAVWTIACSLRHW
jgi:hypothetical protein